MQKHILSSPETESETGEEMETESIADKEIAV